MAVVYRGSPLRLSLGLASCCVIVLTACDQGPTGPPRDGGVDADGGGEETLAVIPWLAEGLPPIAPPMFTPCPDGWREVLGRDEGRDVVTCHPYAEDGPDDCADGWAHFVGDSECTPIGDPCPAGDFPEGLPTDVPVVYVLATAPAGGDGSEASPLSTIGEALGRAWSGTIVAIGKGEYDEALRPRAGVTLWGACTAETRVMVTAPDRFADAIISVSAANTLRNLRLGPADLPGVTAFGRDASVSVDGLLIEGAQAAGLIASAGARAEGREVVISGTRATLTGSFGRGIAAERDGTVELSRVLISDNRDLGVFAGGEGTSVTLSDLVVANTQGRQSDGGEGRGISFQDGATAEVSRALISQNHEVGVYVGDVGTSVTLSDVVITGTQGRENDRMAGRGLVVQAGATATVTRASLTQNRDVGVVVAGDVTSLTLSDVVVDGTQGQESDGMFGGGMAVQEGAMAAVTRAVLSRNHRSGVFVDGESTSVTLSDVVVTDTQEQESDGAFGAGLAVQHGAVVVVERALLASNRESGVFVGGAGASVTLSDVVVQDTQGQELREAFGRGLVVQHGATASVARARISRNDEFGVFAAGGDASVTLADVVVEQTEERSCSTTTCPDRAYGVGLGSFAATLEATRFEVSDSAVCGIMLADDGQVDLSVGQISSSLIGVCLQIDGYAVSRLTDRVRYVGNGTNLDATTLPLPELLGDPSAPGP